MRVFDDMPRSEHPNPQWKRETYRILNGVWEFAFDFSNSGAAQDWQHKPFFDQQIIVPFCPESKLSGIRFTDFMPAVWYRRTIDCTETELQNRVILHVGAADYLTTVYVNGEEVGKHEGGYTSFAFDITQYLNAGENAVTIRCQDDTRDPLICSGKQSDQFASYACMYTRTTGIWQSVWLEYLPQNHIVSAKIDTDPENARVHIRAQIAGAGTLTAAAFWEGACVQSGVASPCGDIVTLTLDLPELHLWEVGKGGLYDLKLTFGEDTVQSYFGMRSLKLDGYKFLINGRSVFQRLVLDQGFYPDGIYTAPSDKALELDILLSMQAGFNGARLHEKVFEPRFLYHADRLGYLCWGEFPNWGGETSRPELLAKFLPQWCEALERDYNHPSIIGWCPFNETNDRQVRSTLQIVYETTKLLDPARPCIDASGYVHVKTDIFCTHEYCQNPEQFAAYYADFADGGSFFDCSARQQTYGGQPMFVSEYGGIGWDVSDGWGYGDAPKTEEAYKARYKGLTDVLLDHPKMFAFCYTQLTDVEQERNGVYTYDRKPKFDPAFFRAVNTRKAKMEED
ncbi:MAG: beta-galactosidase [Oscillospiraceae bacterium]|jgi:beta-galactosidase/beta-glucuronidase|nr:beta-galactosidase [Oscillospiraceae bacterium]